MVMAHLPIKQYIQLTLPPQFVAVGDFNNDTFLDIIVVISDTNNIGILLGYGNGIFCRSSDVVYGLWNFTVLGRYW